MPKMTLSELESKGVVEVVRDGQFRSLGFITISTPAQLAYIEDAKYLTGLGDKTNITCVVTTREFAWKPRCVIIISDSSQFSGKTSPGPALQYSTNCYNRTRSYLYILSFVPLK